MLLFSNFKVRCIFYVVFLFFVSNCSTLRWSRINRRVTTVVGNYGMITTTVNLCNGICIICEHVYIVYTATRRCVRILEYRQRARHAEIWTRTIPPVLFNYGKHTVPRINASSDGSRWTLNSDTSSFDQCCIVSCFNAQLRLWLFRETRVNFVDSFRSIFNLFIPNSNHYSYVNKYDT